MHVRFARAGRAFGAAQRLRAEESFNADFSAAVGRDGRAVLAWSSQFRSEGGGVGPARVQVAVRPGGGARFAAPVLLHRTSTSFEAAGPVAAALLPDGQALVGYSVTGGTTSEAWVAASGGGDRFERRTRLSPAGEPANVADLDVSSSGDAVVVWTRSIEPSGPGAVLAAHRPPGGEFGSPEVVTDAAGAHSPAAAFHPVSRLPSVVWVELQSASGATARVKLATRAG